MNTTLTSRLIREFDFQKLCLVCEECLLKQRKAPFEPRHDDFHSHLPLCILDAVFSINARYESTSLVVDRYCDFAGIHTLSRKVGVPLPQRDQQSVSTLTETIEELGFETFATDVLKNSQRTSTRNGCLKTKAVYAFAATLLNWDIQFMQDLEKVLTQETVNGTIFLKVNADFEKDVREVQGQASGISLRYFLMLTGQLDFIKPDRMILRFLETNTGHLFSADDASLVLSLVVKNLRNKYPKSTPFVLDSALWNQQRSGENALASQQLTA